MNNEEADKFNRILSEGYRELIDNRPKKPLEHFISFILNRLPENVRILDENMNNFSQDYKLTEENN